MTIVTILFVLLNVVLIYYWMQFQRAALDDYYGTWKGARFNT